MQALTQKRRIVPLVNFESTTETLDFGSGISLLPLTQAEANVLGSPHLIGETSHSNRAHTTFKLQLVYEPPKSRAIVKGFGPHEHELHQTLFDVVAALRLHKAGDFAVPVYIEFDPKDERQWETGGFWGQGKRLGLAYELKNEDIATVITLASEIRMARSKGDRRLDLALLRFGDTYGRNRAEDALVDGQIALESCLTPDTSTEVAYRLSMRGAALLADQYPPAETRRLLNLAYDARSKLVHRGFSLMDCFKDREFSKSAEKYGQMTQHKLLPENFGDLTRELVRNILKNVVHLLSSSAKDISELNPVVSG